MLEIAMNLMLRVEYIKISIVMLLQSSEVCVCLEQTNKMC